MIYSRVVLVFFSLPPARKVQKNKCFVGVVSFHDLRRAEASPIGAEETSQDQARPLFLVLVLVLFFLNMFFCLAGFRGLLVWLCCFINPRKTL